MNRVTSKILMFGLMAFALVGFVDAKMQGPPDTRERGPGVQEVMDAFEKTQLFVAVVDVAAEEWQAEITRIDAADCQEVPGSVPGKESFVSVNDASVIHPVLRSRWRGEREVACLAIPSSASASGGERG